MPVDAVPAPKPKKQPVKKSAPLISTPVQESNPLSASEAKNTSHLEKSTEAIADPVIYANNQIVVKVKKEKPVRTVKAVKVPGKRGRKSFKEMDAAVDLIDIPTDEMLKQKLYYSISEVASWFKVNTSLLRYWENEFDILQPRKTRKGDRLFRVEDIKNLQLIYLLLRQRKFSIEGAKAYLKSNKNKIDTETVLVQTLGNFKKFLLELKSSLDS